MAAAFCFESISMKFVGPLPTTKQNNRFMHVVIDYYTRMPEAFAHEHQDAYSIAL